MNPLKEFAPIGHKRWAIAEGYIPETSHGPEPEMTSHESICVLNASDHEAHLQIWIFYSDHEAGRSLPRLRGTALDQTRAVQ